MNREMFNHQILVEDSCAFEPSLYYMIRAYYMFTNTIEDSEELTENYIERWLFDNDKEYLSLYKANAKFGDIPIQNRDGSLNFSTNIHDNSIGK